MPRLHREADRRRHVRRSRRGACGAGRLTRSGALEARRALFAECRDALQEVAGVGQRLLRERLALELIGERAQGAPVDQLAQSELRSGRARGQLGRKRRGARLERRVVHAFRDQADALGFLGADRAAGERQVSGACMAHPAGSRYVAPMSGASPSLGVNSTANAAERAAIVTSPSSASDTPAPAAIPLTATTSGTGRRVQSSTTGWK